MTDETTTPEQETNDPQPALGVQVTLMSDGQFAITATGEPNLGEMAMLLSRALDSIRARMVGETVVQLTSEKQSRIITPRR